MIIRAGRNNKGGSGRQNGIEKKILNRDLELKSLQEKFFKFRMSSFSCIKFSNMTRTFVHREGEREEEEEETNNIIHDRDNKNRQRGINLSHLHLCFCPTVIFLLFLVSTRILSPYLTKGISRLWRGVVVPACTKLYRLAGRYDNPTP